MQFVGNVAKETHYEKGEYQGPRKGLLKWQKEIC